MRASSKQIAKKSCKCLEDVDCEHMNFQDCLPVAWDTNEELIEQQQKYEQLLYSHYGVIDTPRPSNPENSKTESRTPHIPSPNEDQKIDADKQTEAKDEEENFDERAPFIPLSIVDSGLDCDEELLVEIPFIDSPMTPSSWLLNAEESIPSPGSTAMAPPPLNRPISYNRPPSFSTESSPVMSRKDIVPTAVKRNGYVTNEIVSKGKGFFPYITPWDAEVNAPVQNTLLQGDELLRALECGDFL
ncbi:hypothetical protein OS493_008939 [Desmophyllum pertusum]|uniref:HIF-1 alpha C-terminal transactivation domain-containing protein n=1 Tax=Desmophyllum pertusum TaxID=174260 RepID=A0A9W9ZEX3_9CNID|nr:hypothetical protein OS493_008939 [Desmophyllum pertusum]